jgi:precorrin isomerase
LETVALLWVHAVRFDEDGIEWGLRVVLAENDVNVTAHMVDAGIIFMEKRLEVSFDEAFVILCG